VDELKDLFFKQMGNDLLVVAALGTARLSCGKAGIGRVYSRQFGVHLGNTG